jgi:hypothetical protein
MITFAEMQTLSHASRVPPLFPNSPGDATAVAPPTILVREKIKWEYKRIVHDLARAEVPSEEALNLLGDEGWELAAVVNDSPLVYFYFKRLVW